MSTIQNLQSFDPFADATKGDDLLPAGTEDYIHIRIQQRNGRKTLTTVQGIANDYDKKKLVKAFKKKFACNGTVIEHPEYGEVIQLQGDQRKNICQFLLESIEDGSQHAKHKQKSGWTSPVFTNFLFFGWHRQGGAVEGPRILKPR
uniref:Eukaryotic translation initiation factor 1B n=1 Tax=Scleropages formosus TaxID=113540 RepID=A0A8C9TYZ3_SCLFO